MIVGPWLLRPRGPGNWRERCQRYGSTVFIRRMFRIIADHNHQEVQELVLTASLSNEPEDSVRPQLLCVSGQLRQSLDLGASEPKNEDEVEHNDRCSRSNNHVSTAKPRLSIMMDRRKPEHER